MTDGHGTDARLAELRAACAAELVGDILPFWERRAFDSSGYLVGAVADDLTVSTEGPRHSVLASRILWTFGSAVAADIGADDRWEAAGERALRLVLGPFLDGSHGGVYWSLDAEGAPLEDRKQTYAQAFAIYGLAAWYRATGDEEALGAAWELFELLEGRARDHEMGGYVEALARDWGPLADMRLSARDLNSVKSMNTMLHVVEAYTELTVATGDPRARAALGDALEVTLDRIVAIPGVGGPQEPVPGEAAFAHTRLFFDADWTSLDDAVSYGHDIEASWLLWEAARVVGDAALLARARVAAVALADAVLAHGVGPTGGVHYAGGPAGVTEPQYEWWPQAEAVVGWLNAFELTGDARHLDAALAAWDFIDRCVIDHEHGEWFAIVPAATPPTAAPAATPPTAETGLKIGPWKCPYHNARACLEVIRRVAA